MDQPTFADLEFQGKKRKTRRGLFLECVDGLIPPRPGPAPAHKPSPVIVLWATSPASGPAGCISTMMPVPDGATRTGASCGATV